MSDIRQAEIELIETLILWLEQHHQILLVTIISTIGHTPRRVGSQFVLREDGVFIGSVSGGCAEDDLIQSVLTSFPQHPCIIQFGGTEKHARSALACGGQIECAIEPVTSPTEFQKTLQVMENGKRIIRKFHVNSGESYLDETISDNQTFEYSMPWLTIVYGSPWRLLIIGAVEITRYLAPMASMLNYQIQICEPRIAYQNAWRLEDYSLDKSYPDQWLENQQIDQYCAIVTLTHDPRYDDIALIEALNSKAFYIGALGSKRSTEKRKSRLKQIDLSDEAISRLQAPIGISIGSRSSSEIAVSIAAELVSKRSKLLSC